MPPASVGPVNMGPPPGIPGISFTTTNIVTVPTSGPSRTVVISTKTMMSGNQAFAQFVYADYVKLGIFTPDDVRQMTWQTNDFWGLEINTNTNIQYELMTLRGNVTFIGTGDQTYIDDPDLPQIVEFGARAQAGRISVDTAGTVSVNAIPKVSAGVYATALIDTGMPFSASISYGPNTFSIGPNGITFGAGWSLFSTFGANLSYPVYNFSTGKYQ